MLAALGVVCAALLLAGCAPGDALTGSTPTTIQKHPYQVAIDLVAPLVDDDDGTVVGENVTMVCAGALLTNKTVITAAVCAGTFNGQLDLTATTVRVRVGSQFREGGGEAYAVVDAAPHPYYREWLHERNVLLLYLEQEVPLRAEVRPVALVTPATAPKAGEKLLITGYGDLTRNEVLEDGEVRQLRVAAVPLVNQNLCEYWYGFNYGHTNGCIGGGRASVCGRTDVGSPVVNWRGELVGVAINNVNYCGVPGRPTVITYFGEAVLNEWIRANALTKQPTPPPPTSATPPDGCFGDACDDDDDDECDPEWDDCSTTTPSSA